MVKSFFEVIGKMGENEVARRTFKHVMKERKDYVERQISRLEGDLDDLTTEEFDLATKFISAERKDTSTASTSLTNWVEKEMEREDLKKQIEVLKKIYSELFENDAVEVAEIYGVDLTEGE